MKAGDGVIQLMPVEMNKWFTSRCIALSFSTSMFSQELLMKKSLLALAAAFALSGVASAATFDAKTAPTPSINASTAKMQVDAKENAVAVIAADAKKAKTGAFAVKPLEQQSCAAYLISGVDKAVDFKKLGPVKDDMGGAKVSSGGQQLSDGTMLADSFGYKRGLYGQDAGCVAA